MKNAKYTEAAWTAWTPSDTFKLNKAVPLNPLILQTFQSIGHLRTPYLLMSTKNCLR